MSAAAASAGAAAAIPAALTPSETALGELERTAGMIETVARQRLSTAVLRLGGRWDHENTMRTLREFEDLTRALRIARLASTTARDCAGPVLAELTRIQLSSVLQAAYRRGWGSPPMEHARTRPETETTMARYHQASKGPRDSVVGHGHGIEDATDTREPAQDFDALATNVDRPSLRLRLRVSTQSTALDNELARGASPMHSRELALRARQLVEPKRREQLASALDSLCEHAQRASSTSIVPLPRREITEAGASLLALAQRLRDPRPIYAGGAAMISVLLRDGTGPAYRAGVGPELRRRLRAAAAALDGGWPQPLSQDRPTWPD